jgi:hypothetical protein
MPAGVNVSTAVMTGPSTGLRAPSGQWFVVGQAERGPTTKPAVLRGLADYTVLFGDRVSYGSLYDQLKTFFAEGGVQAQVLRVVGPGATAGNVTLTDRADVALPTLRITAASAGAWSQRVRIEVRDGAQAGTFRIIVTLDNVVVEDRTNLTTPGMAALAFANSPYIQVTNLGSASVAPTSNPAVLPPTVLTAGNDDRAAINTAAYVTALDQFVTGLGDGAVSVPGIGPSIHAAIVEHVTAHRRIAILAGGVNDTVAGLAAEAAAIDSDAAGLFAPWVNIPDGSGGFRQISPEGYVAGVRARAHETVGPWRAPAGKIAADQSLLGVAQEYTVADLEALDAARVSPIRVLADSVRLYGWRSLSSDEENFGFLSARDYLNRLVTRGEAVLEDFVYEPIDVKGQLLSSVNAALVGIVEPDRQAGGLYENVDASGRLIDPGYKVETGSEVNSAASLALNQIRARLSVRVAPTGALVSLTIVKIGVLSGL